VANPAPRAAFFADNELEFASAQKIPDLFAANPRRRLLLTPDARKYLPASNGDAPDDSLNQLPPRYSRLSSDEVEVRTSNQRPGFAYVLEAWDPGWTATVDNLAVPLLPANGFAMAIPVADGHHTVRLKYSTPGRAAGAGLSLLSLGLLIALIASARRASRHPALQLKVVE
jgi:hypothetical protein